MKISIIIPAYNVEKYIDSCLTSLVRQDLPLSEYEIIVINDGSTDSTYNKVVGFAKNYPNFVIIDKKYEGPGLTRNKGLEIARGEYVIFIDSDDTIMENCLSSIYSQMKEDDLDILEFDFSYIYEDGTNVVPKIYSDGNYQRPLNVVTSGRDNLLYSDYFIPMIPIHAFKRELLVKNKVDMIHVKHEDENFTPKVYYYAKRVKVIDTPIYNYFKHKSSIMGSYSTNNLFDTIISINLLKKFVLDNIPKDDVELHDFFQRRFVNILNSMFRRSLDAGVKVRSELIREMKKCDLYPFNPQRNKIAKIIFNLSPEIFGICYKRKMRKKRFR